MKENLLNAYNNSELPEENRGLILFMFVKGDREVIANFNGKNKIEYVKEKYDEDLKMNGVSDITITSFDIFDNTKNLSLELMTLIGKEK